jgi:hypothetical protein
MIELIDLQWFSFGFELIGQALTYAHNSLLSTDEPY